jgi:hypothetical protein
MTFTAVLVPPAVLTEIPNVSDWLLNVSDTAADVALATLTSLTVEPVVDKVTVVVPQNSGFRWFLPTPTP